jgi:uncharacterized membrane protein
MAVVVAVYGGARFFRLTESCLWFDEIFTVHAAEHNWGEILNFIALDLIHPPLFYLLLKVWIAVGGDGVFWLRLLPVLFGAVAIFPFVKLCRELRLGNFASLLALFLIAANGSLIKYAQEVRMYSLLMCLSLFSLWLFVRLTSRGKGVAALAAVNLLLVYSHYFGWLVILSEIAATAILSRHILKKILVSSALIFLAFLPWLFAVISASRQGSDVTQNIGWMSRPGIFELSKFLLNLAEPFYQQTTSVEPAANYLIAVPTLLIFVGVIAAYLFLPGRNSQGPLNEPAEAPDERIPVFSTFAIFVLVPVILAFLVSWVSPLSIWGTRHLIIVFAPLAILIAYCVSTLKWRMAAYSTAGVAVLLSGLAFIFVAMQNPPTQSWCVVDVEAERLATGADPAQIYTTDELTAYHAWFATRRKENVSVNVIKGMPGIREDNAYFLPRGFSGITVIRNLSPKKPEGYFFLRSSTLEDHRRNREEYVLRDSLLIRSLNASGIEVAESQKTAAASEDVFLLKIH